MGFWDSLFKFEKTMEKWHNRLYKWVAIVVMMMVFSVVIAGIIGWSNFRASSFDNGYPEVLLYYDFVVYIGGPLIIAFFSYTVLFTGFRFPIGFRGGNGGKKHPPYKPTV